MRTSRGFLRMSFLSAMFLAVFASLSWGACGPVTGNTTTCSSGPFSLTAPNNSQANIYPLTQTVPSGTLSGAVTHVSITLSGITEPDDAFGCCADNLAGMELLLQAPNGTKLVILARAGDGFTDPNTTLQVDDTGLNACDGPTLALHTQAAACDGALFPGGNAGSPNGFPTVCTQSPNTCPLATPPSVTMDNTFNAVTNANGTWSLYVVNNNGSTSSFSFTGWNLTITTTGGTETPTSTSVSPANTSVLRTPPGPSDPATVTASVSSSSTVNGGTVTFLDNGNPVACGTGSNTTVTNGTATCVVTFTQEGTHPITANYAGTPTFGASKSPLSSPANVIVTDRTTSTGVTATSGTFCNTGRISVPASGSAFGPAGPYPSQIFVGVNGSPGLAGAISNLTIDLKAIQHTDPNSPSLLLVSPGGTPYVLMADSYTSGGAQGPANITLSGAASTPIPNTGGFSSGTFLPADYHASAAFDQGVFPAPAPQTGFLFPAPLGFTTLAQAFNGGPAAGTWQLYVLNDAGGSGSIGSGWCLNFTTTAPVLSITKSDGGNHFRQGQQGAHYTITVANNGPGSTSGTVTVTDTLPAGLTFVSGTGSDWSCGAVGQVVTCTNSDAVVQSSTFPALTITVNVANNAPATVTNQASVSGGGAAGTANSNTVSTAVDQAADLTITKSHSGNFGAGDIGDTYSITASNLGPGATVGTVTVSDLLPAGLTATAIAGTGWTCTLGTLTCTRSDALAANSSYPPITLTVNVASNASGSVTNIASVSGGGELNTANDSASDPTTIVVRTTTAVSAASGEYSDTTTLTATVSPTSAGSQVLSGTVSFLVNGSPAGSAPVNGAGIASVSYNIQLGAGSYTITGQFVSGNSAFANSAGTNTLTVTREAATVTPSPSNPFSVQVNTPGGTAGPIALAATIVEVADDSTPGNISNAVPVTCTLTPVVSAPVITQTATVSGGGVGGTLTATCTFNNVPVNLYDVTFTIGGNFYTGASPVTVLAVFDPSAGSTTGGGTLTHNGVRANFGFNAKYLNDGSPQGSLDYVEHRSTGDVHFLGSNVETLSIVGNTAVFLIHGSLNGVSGYTAQVTVVDNGEPGAGNDTFALQMTAPDTTTVADLTFSAITIDGGNIQVRSR